MFFDEAGEALVTEGLVPLQLAAANTLCVMAGDPEQLGPLVRSAVAVDYGLGLSFLEHFLVGRGAHATAAPRSSVCPTCERCENSCVCQSCAPPPTGYGLHTCHLTDSYRAHPELLRLYSDIFYGGTLVPRADPASTEALLGWAGLPTKRYPVLIKHVAGEEDRTGESPVSVAPSSNVSWPRHEGFLQRLTTCSHHVCSLLPLAVLVQLGGGAECAERGRFTADEGAPRADRDHHAICQAGR